MAGDEEMPREAFQRLRDSSFWSGRVDVRRRVQRVEATREFDEVETTRSRRNGRCLHEQRSGGKLRVDSHMDPSKRLSTS